MPDVILFPPVATARTAFPRPSGGGAGYDDLYSYVRFTPTDDGYIIEPGDFLEFEIFCIPPAAGTTTPPPSSNLTTKDNPNATRKFGIDIKFFDGSMASDAPLLDQNGLAVAFGDKQFVAENQWHQVKADLALYVGRTVDFFLLVNEEDSGLDVDGTWTRYIVDFRAIRITNYVSGLVKKVIWLSGALPAAAAGYLLWDPTNDRQVKTGIPGDLNVFGNLGADGTLIVGGGLQTSNISTKLANYTVQPTDYALLGDATAGSFTFTLYTAVGNKGRRLFFKKIDATANTVTIDGAGSETIDGATTKALSAQWSSIEIASDGANWIVVG